MVPRTCPPEGPVAKKSTKPCHHCKQQIKHLPGCVVMFAKREPFSDPNFMRSGLVAPCNNSPEAIALRTAALEFSKPGTEADLDDTLGQRRNKTLLKAAWLYAEAVRKDHDHWQGRSKRAAKRATQ